MKKLTTIVLGLFASVVTQAQIHILAESPGYDASYSIESSQKRLYAGTHNFNVGHFGMRFGNRVSVLLGGKVSFVHNDYGYQNAYYERLQKQIPELIVETPGYYVYGEWASQAQLRYSLRKSFLGEIELGLIYALRWNTIDGLNAYEPKGFGNDALTGYETVESFKVYNIGGSGERNGIVSFSMRKYLNSNRICFFVEPYISAHTVRITTYNRVLSGEWQPNVERLYDTRFVPEVGIKLAATWDKEIHWFDFLKELFEPIEE